MMQLPTHEDIIKGYSAKRKISPIATPPPTLIPTPQLESEVPEVMGLPSHDQILAGLQRRQGVDVEVPQPKSNLTGFPKTIAKELGKFGIRTMVEAANLGSSLINFATEYVIDEVESRILGPQKKLATAKKTADKLGVGQLYEGPEVTETQKNIARKWREVAEALPTTQLTRKLKEETREMRSMEVIQPRKEWVEASLEEKLTKPELLVETVLNLGPGVVSSLGAFALHPALGMAVSVGSVSDEVRDVALEEGADQDFANNMALGSGLLVGWLDKMVPDELFNKQEKQRFISGFVRRLMRTTLKEGGTEIGQETVQMIAEVTVGKDLTLDEFTERIVMAGLGGILGGAGGETIVSFSHNIRSGDIGGRNLDTDPLTPVSTPSDLSAQTQAQTAVQPNTSLVGQEKRAQDFAIDFYTNNQQEMTQNYVDRVQKEFGSTNVVSADEAKYSIPDFNDTKSRAYHETASTFAKQYAQDLLADPVNEGKPVLITAGGSGAGKTTVLRKFEDLGQYALVYDSNLSRVDSAAAKMIDQALSQGREVTVDLVLRDPKQAFEGVLSRMKSKGRIVPSGIHVDTHIGSLETFKNLAEKYGDRVKFNIFENNGTLEEVRSIPIENIADLSYNRDELTRYLDDRIQKAVDTKEITPQQAAVFRESQSEQRGTRQGDAESVQESRTSDESRSQRRSVLEKTDEPLVAEARKYKSADEFIAAQGQPLYHGTNADFTVFDESKIGSTTDPGMFGRGFYFANTESFAKTAPRGRGAKKVMEVYPLTNKLFEINKVKTIKEIADLLNMSEAALVQDPNGIVRPKIDQINQFTSHVKDLGYDGVVVNRGGDAIETVIFDAKNIATKAQLTDTWKQSQKEVTPKKIKPVVKDRTAEITAKRIAGLKNKREVQTALKTIRQNLNDLRVEAEAKSIAAREMREGLDLKKIALLKRVYSRSARFQEGDIETMRQSGMGSVVNEVIESVQEKYPGMSEQEAFDFAIELPTKADENFKPSELKTLEAKEKKLAAYLDQLRVREKELDIKRDQALEKEWQDALAIQEDLAKIISVPRSQLPIETEGTTKLSRLEARMRESLDVATQEEIDALGLATYQAIKNKENVADAAEYVLYNPDEAFRVLAGELDPPPGILRNSIYVAMNNAGAEDSNIALKLASLASTRYGQEISVLQELMADNPVTMMEDIVKVRIEAYERKQGRKSADRIKKEVEKINQEVKQVTKNDWNSFIESIKC